MRWNSPWRPILFTPVPWLLVAATIVVQYLVIDDVAADGEGDELLGLVLMLGAVVPVSWAVLETIWVRFAGPTGGTTGSTPREAAAPRPPIWR